MSDLPSMGLGKRAVFDLEQRQTPCLPLESHPLIIKVGASSNLREATMAFLRAQLWVSDEGQDIAEYAVMLAVILVLVVGTVRLVGSNANNAFSTVASSLQ